MTTVTLSRPPLAPTHRWRIVTGWNDHIATLGMAPTAPTWEADQALAAAGLRRVGDWRPHKVRASWGWMTASVEEVRGG